MPTDLVGPAKAAGEQLGLVGIRLMRKGKRRLLGCCGLFERLEPADHPELVRLDGHQNHVRDVHCAGLLNTLAD
ncbi:MAG: hypothetical protein M3Y37_05520 [Chloroflexota bacterium]|nr:hypothetical protein [Chloroflexota bacterium]